MCFCFLFLFFDLYLSLQVCLLAVIKSSVTNSVFTEVWFSVFPGITLWIFINDVGCSVCVVYQCSKSR